MMNLRICAALALLTCLTGFDWPESDPSQASSPGEASVEVQLNGGTVEDRVVQLDELVRSPHISDAALSQVRELLFSPVDDIRAAAVRVLGAHGRQSDEQLLIRLLSDSSDDVQLVVAQSIGSFGSRATAVALAGLLDDQSADVRVQTLKTLGRFAQPATTFPVLDLLLSHDPRVEMEAVRTLGQIGDPRAIPALAVRLESPNYETTLAAAEALTQIDTLDSLRVVLIHAAGLRPQLMGNRDLGFALAQASTSTLVEVVLEEAFITGTGGEMLEQVFAQIFLPGDVIRAVYAEVRDRVPFDEIPQRLKLEAVLYGVDDERLYSEETLSYSSFSSLVTPQDGETLAESCVADRAATDIAGRAHHDYRLPASAAHDRLYTLRWIFIVCGADYTGEVVGSVPATVAATIVEQLHPGDPLRAWLLSDAATWDDEPDESDAIWTFFASLDGANTEQLSTLGSRRFSESAIGPMLAYGWGTPSLDGYFDMLSNEARQAVPQSWAAYADRMRGGSDAGETSRSSPSTSPLNLLATLQVSLSECGALSAETSRAIERTGSRWVKNLRDMHRILCSDGIGATERNDAIARQLAPTHPDASIEYAPGADASVTAATIWQAAVAGELNEDDVDRCVRYSLGLAPSSIRTACLLAAERIDVTGEQIALMLERLREQTSPQTAGGRDANAAEHTILINDRLTGRGVWGAPLLLFLNDGTTLESTAGAFGFLAVPSSAVAGVAPL